MAHFDIFNGDADGICALHQLRLNQPTDSTLITGTKREINLVERADIKQGDSLTVLDISLEKNIDAINAALEAGASIHYFDHHFAGDIPDNALLDAHIDTSAEVCSSMIVDHHLGGKFTPWAIVGAYGDNLLAIADNMAKSKGYSDSEREQLCELGTCLNYNGYGTSLNDLHFHPADLYKAVSGYSDPLEFIAQSEDYKKLLNGFKEDMAAASSITPEIEKEGGAILHLPDEAWARRVSGVLGNQLAQQHPQRAHALLTVLGDEYRVSVRAPLNNKTGADDLCRQFETGGGRKGAAGINQLPQAEYDRFVELFYEQYSTAV